MRKAFTLVELLVVVVVIVTLMAITFRLGSAGDGQTRRARTVNRMQRLENCLSGYYAAYGSYPPVALHGSRDYRYRVTDLGIQKDADSSGGEDFDERKLSNSDDGSSWKRVEAACRSQPVGMSHHRWRPSIGFSAEMDLQTGKFLIKRAVSTILKRPLTCKSWT